MAVQTLPASAREYSRAQTREIGAALASVKRQWRRGISTDLDDSFALVLPSLLATVERASSRVVDGAIGYVPAVLEETGQDRYATPAGEVRAEAFAGVDGSGRSTVGLLAYAPTVAKGQIAEGATARQAITTAGAWLATAVGTMLSDVARAAETTQMGNHRVGGYIRVLQTPSCSRCAILAGAWYSDSVAFRRHPRCDCRHLPASQGIGREFEVDARQYFDSLDEAEQARRFTKAGAEAIREGADPAQVVNARRGMNTATDAAGRQQLAPVRIGGQDVFVTSEGTTRRGLAYRSLSPSGATDVRQEINRFGQSRLTRYMSANRPRMMPETIRKVATDKDDFVRLLRANGYIR